MSEIVQSIQDNCPKAKILSNITADRMNPDKFVGFTFVVGEGQVMSLSAGGDGDRE